MGTLNAIDLATGKRQWQVTLGEYAELMAEGIPPTGTRNYGGPIVTAGGLLIIAASSDEKLRIFDKTTGELLWQYQLPSAGYAAMTPMNQRYTVYCHQLWWRQIRHSCGRSILSICHTQFTKMIPLRLAK